jgi:hypothetical protein
MTIVLTGSTLIKGEIMRKLALCAAGALLIAFNAFAADTQKIDAQSMAKTILDMHKFTGSEKGSFAIVYGGQDISRGSIGPGTTRFDEPVLVG